MKQNIKNYYYFKFYKGFTVKTNSKFVEYCIGIGILLLCASPFMYAFANLLGK